jgi:hypothetical protein
MRAKTQRRAYLGPAGTRALVEGLEGVVREGGELGELGELRVELVRDSHVRAQDDKRCVSTPPYCAEKGPGHTRKPLRAHTANSSSDRDMS